MKKEKSDNPNPKGGKSKNKEDQLPGYPVYLENEDIYNNYLEEKDIDPEDIHKKNEAFEKSSIGRGREKDLDEDLLGNDLDVPGSELDDDMEIIGTEDEENNYYSLDDDQEDPEE